jgi:exopolyphosphatase / guanosine-5'-triphosphate,3'-diphosphate pyrophosphatase
MPDSTPAVVPRWEWRTFADDLALVDPSNELTPSEMRESDEVYALSPGPASVKFRDDVVDVKVLEQVDDAGLEQWRPVLKAALPLSADDVGVLLDALDVTSRPRLDRPSYGLEELRGLFRGRVDVHVVDVHKTRRLFQGGGCRAELTTVRVGGEQTETIAIESEDPASVAALVQRLGFPLRPNVSMPHGLEQLAQRSAPRYAVIDVGTNSVKFHLAERAPDAGWQTVVDRSEITRLGEGLDETGELQPEPTRRTLEAIAAMVSEARHHGVRSIAAVGTAGMRIASNADEFVERVRSRTGVEIEVISGEEESRLAYLAAKAGIGLSAGRMVVFDTGGGSSQFTFGSGERVEERFSVNVGAVRLTERFGLDGPVGAGTLAKVMDAIGSDLTRLDGRPRPDELVALGGVVTNLAAVMHALARYDPDIVQGTTLDRTEIDRQIELYRARTADERRGIIGLQPGRAEVVLAGACIVRTTMEKLGCESLVVSDRGLRHGVLLERFDEAPLGPAHPETG